MVRMAMVTANDGGTDDDDGGRIRGIDRLRRRRGVPPAGSGATGGWSASGRNCGGRRVVAVSCGCVMRRTENGGRAVSRVFTDAYVLRQPLVFTLIALEFPCT